MLAIDTNVVVRHLTGDLADALHVGRSEGCEAFVTFDRKLVGGAGGIEQVREP